MVKHPEYNKAISSMFIKHFLETAAPNWSDQRQAWLNISSRLANWNKIKIYFERIIRVDWVA